MQSDGRCLSNGSLHPGAAVGTLLIAGHLQRHVGKCVEVSYNGAGRFRQNHPNSHLAIPVYGHILSQSHHVIPRCITNHHHRKNSMIVVTETIQIIRNTATQNNHQYSIFITTWAFAGSRLNHVLLQLSATEAKTESVPSEDSSESIRRMLQHWLHGPGK